MNAFIRLGAVLALGVPPLAWSATICKPGDTSARCTAASPAPAPVAAVPVQPAVSRAPVAAAAAPAAPVEAGPEKRYWDVRMDDRTIQGALVRWGASAKPRYQVIWETMREFPIVASDSDHPFYGTFEEAVDRVLDSFATSDYPLKGCLYSNGVLRVVRRVDDGLECKR
jgi:hypothetical protein